MDSTGYGTIGCKRFRRRHTATRAATMSYSLILLLQIVISCQCWDLVHAIGPTHQKLHDRQQSDNHFFRERPGVTRLLQEGQQNAGTEDASSTTGDSSGACPITCFNGATCKQGNATFTSHPKNSQGDELEIHHEKSIKGYHCGCQAGFTGVSCNVPYETCADGNSTHVCYHGGTCVPGVLDELGNEQYHCDCSSASTSLASSEGGSGSGTDGGSFGSRYAGKYCEHALNVCKAGGDGGGGDSSGNDGVGMNFCANGGACKENPTPAEPPCKCEPEWTGAHCEFSVEDEQLPPVCKLDCQNGGTCQVGVPIDRDTRNPKADDDYSSFTYCLCPEGFGGTTCEVPVADPCGDKDLCKNGARCVVEPGLDGIVDDDDFYCDCVHNITEADRYAGRYCQYKATAVCANNHNGVSFCVNNGECIDEGAGIFSCECPDGFHGPRCEFEDVPAIQQPNSGGSGWSGNNDGEGGSGSSNSGSGNGGSSAGNGSGGGTTGNPPSSGSGGSATGNTGGNGSGAGTGVVDAAYEVCTLECMNGGQCREGAKDLSGSYLDLGPELSDPSSSKTVDLSKSTAGNFEHCDCPIGYTGVKCEYEVDECRSAEGDVEHICLHGSRCTKPEGAKAWSCDCEDAFTESQKYAGKFCQHHQTTTCESKLDPSRPYEGPVNLAFCVNDGVCIDIVEDGKRRQGCKCPAAYNGEHCELLKKVKPNQGGSDGSSGLGSASDYAILFTIFLLVIVLMVIGWSIYYRLKENAKYKRKRLERDHIDRNRVRQEASNMEEMDFDRDDEEDMEDVELL